jgi:uncharacterized Zn finger protein
MTTSEQYAKALQRAHAEGVTVTVAAPNLYAVRNASNGHEYIVNRHGEALDCTCPAGRHDHLCKHVSAVREYRIEAHARRDAVQAQVTQRMNWLADMASRRAN